MATDSSHPPVPTNYVTIHDLRERWMKKRQQEEPEKEQQPKLEPTLPQPQRRNHVRRQNERSSAAAIEESRISALAATQAEESRVSAVGETRTTRESKPKWHMKKKFGIDGKGKARVADGGVEDAPSGKAAGESVSSTDLLKGGTFKVEVKCVSTESKAMQQFQPIIRSRNRAMVWKVAGESVAIEKKVSKNEMSGVKIQKDGLDTESFPKIKNAYPANPTFKMEEEFKGLSMQGDSRGYLGGGHGGGRGHGRSSFYGGGEMVWMKKVEKAHSGSSS